MKKSVFIAAVLLALLFLLPSIAEKASVQVTAYYDSNNNGERGTYERLVPDVTVTLKRVTDAGEAEQGTHVTGSDGVVSFTGLEAGTYVLETAIPDTWSFTKRGEGKPDSNIMDAQISGLTQKSTAFTVADSEEKKLGIGLMKTAKVTGQVWLDDNADGIRAESDEGVGGVHIEVYSKADENLRYETYSAEDGTFSIGQIKAGTYRLRVTAPEGMGFTRYSKSGGKNRSVITTEGKQVGAITINLDAGDELENQNVGLIAEGTITGRCFLDANYNGLCDEGEEMLAGVELEVIRQRNNDSVATVKSGKDGTFTFTALRDGSYKVRALLPAGNAFTAVVEGGNQFRAREGRREYTVSDVTVATGRVTEIVVGAIKYGSISGYAYLDDNFSGTKDKKEKIVSGIIVRLLDADGNIIAKDKTNGKGKFEFPDLVPGIYTLTTTAKTGYAFTKLGEGNCILNDNGGEGHSEPITIGIATALEQVNIGMILPGTVKGEFFGDSNDNGKYDSGEKGLAGTAVRLMSEEGEHFSAVIDESGSFIFDAVMPGTYWLTYELPEHAIFAKQVSGGNTLASDTGTAASDIFEFTVGSTVEAKPAGGLLLGEISGTAFADSNGSGLIDENEAFLPGMKLTLTPSRDDLAAVTAVTDAAGRFAFRELHPDTWTLTAECPDGMVISRTDSIALPLQPGFGTQEAEIVLEMGDTYTEQTVGAAHPASISGTAWLDENNDGNLDADEASPEGLTVQLTDQSSGKVYADIPIASDGSFTAAGIVPGSYTLSFAMTDQLRAPLAGDATFIEEGDRLVMRDITVREGDAFTGAKLGIVRYNKITGRAWVDRGSSVEALKDVAVILTDGSNKLATVRTAEDGTYAFDGLLPGTYALTVALPEGQVVVEQNDERLADGSLTSIMTVTDGRRGETPPFEVTMTGEYTDMDIGSVLPGTVGDRAWLDENGNGMQDSSECGLKGVRIELIRDGRTMGTAETNEYGYWIIEDVYPAVYTLRVTPPAEIKPTKQTDSVPMLASVLIEGEDTVCVSGEITVPSDGHNFNADLGFVLRQSGVYPMGYGTYATQNWTKIMSE